MPADFEDRIDDNEAASVSIGSVVGQETWRWSPPPRAGAAGLSTLWSNVTHGGFDGLHNV